MAFSFDDLQRAAAGMGMQVDPLTGQIVPTQQTAAPPVNPPPPPAPTPGLADRFQQALGSLAGTSLAGLAPQKDDVDTLKAGAGTAMGVGPNADPVTLLNAARAPQGAVSGGAPKPPPMDDGQVTFGGGGGGGMPTGPQYATIPAHYFDTLGPEVRGEANEAARAQVRGFDSQRTADESTLGAQKQIMMDRAAAYEQLQKDAAAREAQRQAVLRANEDEQAKAAEEVARTKIDPEGYWNSRNDGQKVAGYVAVLLGGFLAGKYGGPNQAMEQINKEVDRNIAAQKDNLANKQGKVQNLRSLYAQKLQRFGDERTAEAAAKSDILNAVLARGDAMAADAQSPQIQANWEKSRAKFLDDRMRLDAQTQRWVPAQTVQVGGGVAGATGPAGTVEGTPIYVGGGKYVIPPNNVGPDLAKRVAINAQMQDKMATLSKLYAQRGVGDAAFQSQLENQIDRTIADLETDYTVAKGQGAMSEGDRAVTDQAMGAIKGWKSFTGDPSALIKDAQRAVKRSNATWVQTMGAGTVYQKGDHVLDKNGALKQQWVPVGEYDSNTGDVASSRGAGPVAFKPR